MKISSIVVLLLCCQVSCASSSAMLQAPNVLSEIEQRGAHAVVQELYKDTERWQALLKAVSSGSHEWLTVATKLRPGTDAGSSEMLETAIFFALGNAPVESLKLISAGTFSVEGTCSSNFLIDTPADQDALSMIDKRIAVLKIVKDPNLVATRDLCIKGLQQARNDVLKTLDETRRKTDIK